MKKLAIALLAAPIALFSASALAGDPPAAAEQCLDCHEGADFEGMTAADLTGAINGIVAGEVKHPGVDLAEADVADVAAYFAAEAAKSE